MTGEFIATRQLLSNYGNTKPDGSGFFFEIVFSLL